MVHNTIIVICGPTATGKTKFAHNLAKKHNGEIVNCDAMQIYKQLPILTSSPEASLISQLPYHLYNFLGIDQEFSVIRYVELASTVIKGIINRGNVPIIVGGSGMYINALLYGYNALPSIDPDIRKNARELYSKLGKEKFFEQLKSIDTLAEHKVKPSDTQRMLRAYETIKQSGQSIFSMRNGAKILPLQGFNFEIFCLSPDRSVIYQNCNNRLIQIFQSGAIDEAMIVHQNYQNSQSSAMKTIGLQELILYLNGAISLPEATALAQTKTRQYAKRQITWFKHQLPQKIVLTDY